MDDQHDSLCRQQHWTGSDCFDCRLIARVCADERRRELLAVCECGCMERDAHAESVAARLVEVICQQERTRQIHVAALHGLSVQGDVLESERDAARAEVAVLRDQIAGMYQAETFTDTDGYPSTRVFKAEVVGQNEWAAHIRREVLADLRAKAEVLPERADAHTEQCPGRPGYRGICTCEGDILISRAAVLALFDGGDDRG